MSSYANIIKIYQPVGTATSIVWQLYSCQMILLYSIYESVSYHKSLQTDWRTDGRTERHTDTQTHIHTNTQAHRHTDRERERERERETERQRDRETERERLETSWLEYQLLKPFSVRLIGCCAEYDCLYSGTQVSLLHCADRDHTVMSSNLWPSLFKQLSITKM
jgi:hypothetical protein